MVPCASTEDDQNVTVDSETVVSPAKTPETAQLPDFIKTQSGAGITFYDRRKIFPSRVRYGSMASACLVKTPSVNPGPVLEKLMETGFVEEMDGSFNQELAVPVEFVTLPDGETCGVLLTNLADCVQGFTNLQIRADMTVPNLFGLLSKLSNAISCLADNELYFCKWDGHQFYSAVQFGMVTVVLDGESLQDDAKLYPPEAVNRALSAALLYYLTGALPTMEDGTPYETSVEVTTQAILRFQGNDQTVQTEDPCAEVYWNALPQKLRDTFAACFFAPDAPAPSAQKWAQLFADLAQTVEGETCFHCGRQVISGVAVCPHCGQNLDKRNLLSKWLVTDPAATYKFGFVLPVNMILDYAVLSPSRLKGNLLRMGYSKKQNMLALQNISGDVLSVDYGEEGTLDVEPKGIFTMKSGMQITCPRMQGMTLTLLGFDPQDSWEVE